MKGVTIIRAVAVWLAVAGFCLPQVALATTPETTCPSTVVDVALHDGGVLLGQVVDPQGVSLASVPVLLKTEGQPLAEGKTDTNGGFAFRGLQGGVYQLVAAEGHAAYRLWAPGTAPPSARPGALVIVGRETVRGQCGALGFWLSNPWVIAGIVAAAVSIPVAIHNAKDGQPASPP